MFLGLGRGPRHIKGRSPFAKFAGVLASGYAYGNANHKRGRAGLAASPIHYGKNDLLKLNLCASLFKLLLHGFGLGLGDTFLDGCGGRFD